MTSSQLLDRRSVLQGVAGMTLALPVLEAMGKEVSEQPPRRFCALYTANGMSLPKKEHKIDDWSWFPTVKGKKFAFGKSTEPLSPFRNSCIAEVRDQVGALPLYHMLHLLSHLR